MQTEKINAYIIPKGATKVLGEEGWEFVSPHLVPVQIVRQLASLLGLKLTKSFVGIDTYANEETTMSVVCDLADSVEFVDLNLAEGALTTLRKTLASLTDWIDAELFIPDSQLHRVAGT